jgi:hypothetical protein
MATAFPPLDTGTVPGVTPGHDDEPDDELLAVEDLAGRQPFDFARDVQWVYQHLGPDVRPQDAPTAGAWGLLTWTRRNLGRFFESVLPRAKSDATDEEQEWRPFAKKSVAEVRAIIMEKMGPLGNSSGGT